MRPVYEVALATAWLATAVSENIMGKENADATRLLDGPRYNVQLLTAGLPGGKIATGSHPVVMTKKNGKKYRCHLPGGGKVSANKTDQEAAKRESVEDYLRQLDETCFFRLEGWWTYEFCFNKQVRQYHQEKNAVSQEYKLGVHPLETRPPKTDEQRDFAGKLVLERSRQYWVQTYENGTECDLTGQLRSTEVRFFCAPGEPSYLASIEEVSTCRYLLIFNTNLLCKHPSFSDLDKSDKPYNIQCEPLDLNGNVLKPPPLRKKDPTKSAKKEGSSSSAAEAPATSTPTSTPTSSDASQPSKQTAQAPASSDSSSSTPSSLEHMQHRALQYREKHGIKFALGQCLIHKKYNYRGVIVGYDETCKQNDSWMKSNGISGLKLGAKQPFYHVLADVRDRPGAQVTYVAQENILLDEPTEQLQHPLINEMFTRFQNERYVPNSVLTKQYDRPA